MKFFITTKFWLPSRLVFKSYLITKKYKHKKCYFSLCSVLPDLYPLRIWNQWSTIIRIWKRGPKKCRIRNREPDPFQPEDEGWHERDLCRGSWLGTVVPSAVHCHLHLNVLLEPSRGRCCCCLRSPVFYLTYPSRFFLVSILSILEITFSLLLFVVVVRGKTNMGKRGSWWKGKIIDKRGIDNCRDPDPDWIWLDPGSGLWRFDEVYFLTHSAECPKHWSTKSYPKFSNKILNMFQYLK